MMRARRFRTAATLLWLSLALVLLPRTAGGADLNRLMFVVKNGNNPSAKDDSKVTQFQAWGYTVTLVDDGATQATFDAAAASNDVAYVSTSVAAATVGTKLKNFTIGVVNEHNDLADEFGFADSSTNTRNATYIKVLNNTHYITYGLTVGSVTILTDDLAPFRHAGRRRHHTRR